MNICKVVITPYVIMSRYILLATYCGIDINYVHNDDIITSDQNKITKLK